MDTGSEHGNQGNGPKDFRSWKHKELRNFTKTLGICFAQVVNSMILKVIDILIFVAEFFFFFLEAG